MSLLEHIREPNDIKDLNSSQLIQLCEEVRKFLLTNIASTGGHLASNLGVVELTIALHYIYNSPSDKIIWDVGHQSYIHKILTSRREQFHTLRQFGGLSGFPKRKESAHDIFETGHSSTSISAALGIARARDLKHEKYSVIAVIGDGALSGGMAFEALNDAGRSRTDLTIILNDNEMSISKNVGALAAHLSNIRSNPRYNWLKKEVEHILRSFPLAGQHLANAVEKIKNSFKYLVVPGVIFEEMGFTYIGPIDGHNLPRLTAMLDRSKDIRGPVLIHVVTKKGKGYSYSESNPEQYHSVPPFDAENGWKPSDAGKLSYAMAFGQHLCSLAAENPAIVAITAAMPDGTGLSQFRNMYPDRFFDVGIAEQHAVTLAAGMAINGLKPVFAVYSTFLQRSYDQILHDVCQQNLPVVFAISHAGLVGEDGETHQGAFDLSYLRHIPNLTIMAPKNINEMENMLDYAITMNSPVAIRFPKGRIGNMENSLSLPLSGLDWETLQNGDGPVILAAGSMVETAAEACEILNNEDIYPTLINARIIKPLDVTMLDILSSKAHNGLWITVEDNSIQGGFGSSVNEFVMQRGLDIRVLNIGLPDRFITHGSVRKLRDELKLSAPAVAARISSALTEGRRDDSHAGFPQRAR